MSVLSTQVQFFKIEDFMTIDTTNRTTPMSALLFMSPEQIATELGGDVNASVAAMMLIHAKQMRELVQTARSFEEENLRIHEERQVRAMHEQADRIRAAGITEGVGLMASGGFQIASGIVGLSGTTLRSGELTPRAQGTQAVLQGAGAGANGVSQLVAAGDKHAADVANIEATAAEHRAEAAKRRLDDLEDEAAEARDLTKKVIEFLRDQTRTKAGTDNAAASIRG